MVAMSSRVKSRRSDCSRPIAASRSSQAIASRCWLSASGATVVPRLNGRVE